MLDITKMSREIESLLNKLTVIILNYIIVADKVKVQLPGHKILLFFDFI